jgi:hypothetical protein
LDLVDVGGGLNAVSFRFKLLSAFEKFPPSPGMALETVIPEMYIYEV